MRLRKKLPYYFFMDESGDHNLDYVDPDFPLIVLCGCLFRADHLEETEKQINELKLHFFGNTEVVLHSRDVRKHQKGFETLRDPRVREEFYQRLNQLMECAVYNIIAAAIDKRKHTKIYGRGANDPYALSLSFIMERLIYCLDALDRRGLVHVIGESRGKREDRMLESHFDSMRSRGTYYVSSDRTRERLLTLRFRSKDENVIGLQIADLCAYPLARHLIRPGQSYCPFQVIEDKIYCRKDGVYDGWGLKVFP